jgi:methionyl-tRNA formyltransferase
VFQFASLKSDEAKKALKELDVELGIMAFVLQFAPQDFVNIPKRGTIQYHPSLLPKYRGPSSINWPIARGDSKTGLTIFRPTDGLDEGPVILQKRRRSGRTTRSAPCTSTACSRWACRRCSRPRIWSSRASISETVQDESQATYEGWFRKAEAQLHWASHVDSRLQRRFAARNPAPGAWTTLEAAGAADLRRAQDPGAHASARCAARSARSSKSRQRLPGHRAGRPHRSAAREARRRQEGGRRRADHVRFHQGGANPLHLAVARRVS